MRLYIFDKKCVEIFTNSKQLKRCLPATVRAVILPVTCDHLLNNPNSLYTRIASSIEASPTQVASAVELLDGGATVPFISRYRKEATGGLSDSQLRTLEERLVYLREFDQRRDAIIESINEQGKLDDALHKRIMAVNTKSALEDLYLPYKKKRRTKGQVAIEAGLEPLADALWAKPDLQPEAQADKYVNKDSGVADTKAALDGARSILIERFAEDAVLIGKLRELLLDRGFLCSSVIAKKAAEGEKFSDYFDHQELYSKVPSHRALAMFRGRTDGVLSLKLLVPQTALNDELPYGDEACVRIVASHLDFNNTQAPADAWREQVVSWVWKVKLSVHLETELFTALKMRSDEAAIGVFANNLRDLLLAAPAGQRATLGLDPGFRTGVKVAVINAMGDVVAHTAIFPHPPQKQWQASIAELVSLCNTHNIQLLAVGNGTASRETEKLADEVIKQCADASKKQPMSKVLVSEAGASVYSASTTAEQEFPDLDVTIRGAISIARRLQDPLAELVKIDPKAIGVGQYQHDVSQPALAKSLNTVMEDCVNAVGVNLNTASSALLSSVAGLNQTLADNIVTYRAEHGAFKARTALKKVPRLGPKAFEQAAGFLRIPDGSNPLDSSGVHPEAYPLVKRLLDSLNEPISTVIGNGALLNSVDHEKFTDESFGLPTVKDILDELQKPGRDPRPEFKAVAFADGIEKISDLTLNQILEGQVTNVTAFGAFVDVGVHQDGLVHISAMSDQYIEDPRTVVRAGDIIKVKVMNVEIDRKRIALSMRLSDDAAEHGQGKSNSPRKPTQSKPRQAQNPNNKSNSAKNRNSSAKQNPKTSADQPSALALSLKAALDKS